MLQSMGVQRVRRDLVTEQQQNLPPNKENSKIMLPLITMELSLIQLKIYSSSKRGSKSFPPLWVMIMYLLRAPLSL